MKGIETGYSYGNKGFQNFVRYQNTCISMVAPSDVVFKKFETLLVKMAQDIITNESIAMNYNLVCDIETIMWLIYVVFKCWKWCKVWTSMLKTKRPSFATLWVMWNVNLTCITCICVMRRNTTTLTFPNFKTSLNITLILCTLCHGTIQLLMYQMQHYFIKVECTRWFTKHARWLMFATWSFKKFGQSRCKRWRHNALELHYNWSTNFRRPIPCTRILECYGNYLPTILVTT